MTSLSKNVDNEIQYVRLTKTDSGEPKSMDVAVARFKPTNLELASKRTDVYVDLIGALHVAEPSYYAELNRRFQRYDAVLYELVAPKGTRIPLGGTESNSAFSMLQGGMTTALGLSFQLDEIDYTKRNLVHADMSPEEFSASMKKRGESVGKMIFRAMGQAMAKQSAQAGSTDLGMLAAVFSDNREHAMKLVLAKEFADLDGAMTVYGGKDGSTLVTERNKKALSVLREQLEQGKRKIAIFYGAGHMKDMEERLQNEFKMQRKQVVWLEAWDLTEAAEPAKQ